VTASAGPTPERASLWRFLEFQNLGLNLPFALAFIFVAAVGLPTWQQALLIVVALVAGRNAGHSFNRWADRRYDALNPRTASRDLVTGARSPAFALAFAFANAALVIVAAYFLNPLAFALSPVAIALIFGYSYTKRYTAWTTVFLGVAEAAIPIAVFIAIDGRVPSEAWAAAVGLVLWGTAFETIHSLGDVDADRAAGLRSVPVALGPDRARALVPALHAAALVAFVGFGWLANLAWPYYVGLGLMGAVIAYLDLELFRSPSETRRPFRLHFVLSGLFLAGTVLAIFLP